MNGWRSTGAKVKNGKTDAIRLMLADVINSTCTIIHAGGKGLRNKARSSRLDDLEIIELSNNRQT
jgi:hypothetical protein